MVAKYKYIQDTVHGRIQIPSDFFKYIINTLEFQRLRRIEQTSIRAIFPAARHDRFIHSLGVFDYGCKIINHLEENSEFIRDYKEKSKSIYSSIIASYKVACLLHDVGHAPFSHSFEEYYGSKSSLFNTLTSHLRITPDSYFNPDDPAHHEYASAILAVSYFKDKLKKLDANPELVARMIIGWTYNDPSHELENCYISLLNGGIVDADRLDYANRDVWASGYSTASIDVDRLIGGMDIKRDSSKILRVCFSNKVLNEIESLVCIKDFQVKAIFNHHSVVYDQYLLTHAAENMAQGYYPSKSGVVALSEIINIKTLTGHVQINKSISVSHIADEDLLFLMKNQSGNLLYQEWASRQYTHFALWKSIEEYNLFFNNIQITSQDKLFEVIKQPLLKEGYEGKDIIIKKIKIKPKTSLNNLCLSIGGEVITHKELMDSEPQEKDTHKDCEEKAKETQTEFFYIFLKKNKAEDGVAETRWQIMRNLVPYIKKGFPI